LGKTTLACQLYEHDEVKGHVESQQTHVPWILHSLKALSEEDGWALLKQQCCKGVPSTVKVIGGILSTEHPTDWDRIKESELWDIQPVDVKNFMLSSLLRYNRLINVSTKAYSIMSIFDSNQTLEEIGEKYIEILVNYSFLKEEKEGLKSKYEMHMLAHDLASYVSIKDLLVWMVGAKLEDNIDVRRVVFNLEEEDAPEILTINEKIRTISFWGGAPTWNSLILCAPYIHTLVIVNIGLKEVPTTIEQLLHLRYLDLSDNTMEVLP
ncbi:putative disease resistance protein RGA3, partial [Bienertia sinuspersici]